MVDTHDIDAAIAADVMGWTLYDLSQEPPEGVFPLYSERVGRLARDGSEIRWIECYRNPWDLEIDAENVGWHPSWEMNHAWMVVMHMDRDYTFQLEENLFTSSSGRYSSLPEPEWIATFTRREGEHSEFRCAGPSAPLAICRAALAAVRPDPNPTTRKTR